MNVLNGVAIARVPWISSDDPLFGILTNEDIGFDTITWRPKTAKDILDEMRNYLSVQDPDEKSSNGESEKVSLGARWGSSRSENIFMIGG